MSSSTDTKPVEDETTEVPPTPQALADRKQVRGNLAAFRDENNVSMMGGWTE